VYHKITHFARSVTNILLKVNIYFPKHQMQQTVIMSLTAVFPCLIYLYHSLDSALFPTLCIQNMAMKQHTM